MPFHSFLWSGLIINCALNCGPAASSGPCKMQKASCIRRSFSPCVLRAHPESCQLRSAVASIFSVTIVRCRWAQGADNLVECSGSNISSCTLNTRCEMNQITIV
jgi:hypothetical protein